MQLYHLVGITSLLSMMHGTTNIKYTKHKSSDESGNGLRTPSSDDSFTLT